MVSRRMGEARAEGGLGLQPGPRRDVPLSDDNGVDRDMSSDATIGAASDATKSVRDTASRLYDSAGQPLRATAQAAGGQADELATFVREQPLTAALVALMVGYILGKIT